MSKEKLNKEIINEVTDTIVDNIYINNNNN